MSATEQDYLPTVLYRIQRKYNPRHYMNFIGFPWLYIQPKYVLITLGIFTIALLRLQTVTGFPIRAVIGLAPAFVASK